MKLASKSLVCATIAFSVLALGAFAADNPPTAYLPGVLSADPYPHGCVDCHIDQGGGKDQRVNVEVEKIAKHPDLTRAFKKTMVPESCFLCHKADSKLGSLAANLHKVHFAGVAENDFVRLNSGSCLNCHSLNPTTGEMAIKHGQANW